VTTLLEDTLIADTLKSLPGWQGDHTRIWRDVHLDAEQDAELRRQIEVDGESMGHTPSYEQGEGGTRIVLRTEEAGGVTELDVILASHISDLVHRLAAEEPGIDAHRHDESIVIFRAGEGAGGDEQPAADGELDITPTGPIAARMRGLDGKGYKP